MKIDQKPVTFNPIVITLETEQDALNFAQMVYHISSEDSERCNGVDQDLWCMMPSSITKQIA